MPDVPDICASSDRNRRLSAAISRGLTKLSCFVAKSHQTRGVPHEIKDVLLEPYAFFHARAIGLARLSLGSKSPPPCWKSRTDFGGDKGEILGGGALELQFKEVFDDGTRI